MRMRRTLRTAFERRGTGIPLELALEDHPFSRTQPSSERRLGVLLPPYTLQHDYHGSWYPYLPSPMYLSIELPPFLNLARERWI